MSCNYNCLLKIITRRVMINVAMIAFNKNPDFKLNSLNNLSDLDRIKLSQSYNFSSKSKAISML